MEPSSKRTAPSPSLSLPRFGPWLAGLVATLVVVSPLPLAAAGPAPGHPSWQMDTGG